jgi:hypothetical protein
VGVAACGTKTPLFAAFNGLKTRSLYVILSLIKNIRSILTRTHHERSFDHVDRNKRTQAEAGSIRLSEVPHTWVCGQAEADFIIPEAKRNPDNSRSASETERQGAKALAKWDNSPLSAKPP